ncbi:hypothetical protein A9P91_21805 [Klebsiella quasipneumoniae subsp. similipneumoniae]|nr:hypothetical protein A9P91_21805 [Klebsiella quasipneumoniae subsp. similipneumoniae]
MKQTPDFLRWRYLNCYLQTNHCNRLRFGLQKYLQNRYLPRRQILHRNRLRCLNQILRPWQLAQTRMLPLMLKLRR